MALGLRKRMEKGLDKYLTGESMDSKQILALFFPILIDQAFIIGLNLLNTAMISSSGVTAVSAVNMVDSLNVFMINVFVAIATGGTVVVAQYKGSGNPLMVSRATAASITSVASISLLIGLTIMLLHNQVLSLLFGSATAEVMGDARTYLIGSCISYVGLGIVQAVNGSLRGVGKTRASLFLSLIMNLLYVLLNIVFITLLDMGVLGMTLAVIIARFAGAACALVYLFKWDATLHLRIRDLFQMPLSILRKILFIGVPFAMEQMFFNGGKLLTQVFIVGMGTHAIAANAIGSTLAMVFQVPASALSLTIITVVGQCMGRRDIADARKFIRTFLWLGSGALALTGLILMPLFYPLVGLFSPPADIVDEIFWLLLMTAVLQIPLWSISFVLPAALRAAGDSKFTSITSMLTMWLFRISLGYVLGVTLGYGLYGVWVAMIFEWGVRGAIFLWRFRGKKWYEHRLI